MTKKTKPAGFSRKSQPDTCVIIHPVFKQKLASQDRINKRALESEVEEAEGLAHAIALDILQTHVANIAKITPGYLFGSGTREEIGLLLEELKPTVVIVNFNLTPVQQRNLEKEWNVKVIDRTGLILEIFGSRAQTKEGQIQVELAALNYQRSRLVKSWSHLERQRGGLGKTGGPGETQLEIDRRLVDEKILRLKKQLQEVRRTRDLQRKSRERVPFPIVALVGYTNAGKSTLFNTLTGADVFAEDLPFATLDPTMRSLILPNKQTVILSDTVGFISDLPTHLVAAFRATLEQVLYADIILHVRDVSSPEHEAQKEDVMTVLQDLGIDYQTDERIIEVLNKIDRLDHESDIILDRRDGFKGERMRVSALKGKGLKELQTLLQTRLADDHQAHKIKIDAGNGKALAWLHRNGAVQDQKLSKDNMMVLSVALAPSILEKFRSQFPDATVSKIKTAK